MVSHQAAYLKMLDGDNHIKATTEDINFEVGESCVNS